MALPSTCTLHLSLCFQQGREISPLVSAYIRLRVEEHRREEEARGIVRGASFF